MVRALAFHADDPGSIPDRVEIMLLFLLLESI